MTVTCRDCGADLDPAEASHSPSDGTWFCAGGCDA